MAEAAEISSKGSSFTSFVNLEFARQVGLMVGLAASVAIGIAVAMWSMETEYRPLMADMNRVDSASVLDVLMANQIEYQLNSQNGSLLVDSKKYHEARMLLASSGLAVSQSPGYEILDKEQSLGTSQFMENARYLRGLEGELARTISNISSVRNARVHLAIPKTTVFLRDQRQPRASVFIDSYQGRRVSEEQVRSIANIVASSVSELSLQNVTVVDQFGNLLSNFDSNAQYAEAGKQLDYTRQIEMDILQRVNGLLDPIIGADKFRAEVAVDLDFTTFEQASETFNPDLPAVRSEQVSSEQLAGNEQSGGVPGALSNQPPETGSIAEGEEGQATEVAPSTSRTNETRNYELDRTISHTRNHLGKVLRLTVAVAIDDLEPPASSSEDEEEGTTAAKVPWEQNDLDRLTLLVQNAVGFSAARGDKVTVINTPFLRVDPEPLPDVVVKLWEQAWFMSAAKMGLGAVGFLILVFMVLRPTMKNLAIGSRKIKELEAKHQAALDAVNEVAAGANAVVGEDGTVTLTGGDGSNMLPRPTSNLNTQIKMVKDLVNEDPERVVQVVKGWSASE